ncbi:hypothetical protein [Duganella sp.]
MSIEAERTWLLIVLQLAHMQVDIKHNQVRGPGTGRLHYLR